MTDTSTSYTPGVYAGGPLENYLFQELQRISEVITPIADGSMDKRHVIPSKPRSGLFYADGSDWDPGSGEGIYVFDEDAGIFKLVGGGFVGIFNGLGTWRHRTETATPPASGQIRFNNATPTSATEVFIHETNDGGTDVANFLNLLTAGSILYIQDRGDADNFFLIEISTNTDSGAYRTFGINNITLQGVEPSQNQQMMLFIVEGGAASASWTLETASFTLAAGDKKNLTTPAYTGNGTTDLDFVDGGAGNDSIVRTSGSWITDGFINGATIEVTGSVSNDGTYVINSAPTATTLTVVTASLTTESDVAATVSQEILATLPTTLAVGDEIVVHNASNSTAKVSIDPATHTIKGPLGDITPSDTLILAIGETAHMVGVSTSVMELV